MNARRAPREGDEKVMELLSRTVAEEDRVPAEVVDAARQAWTWRTIDAELAELAHDSTMDDDALAGVRGAATLRALSFAAGSLFIEVEVSEDGDRRGLVGQVMPPPDADPSVVVEGADGRPSVALPIDELGRFAVDRLAPGLVRLRVAGSGAELVTEWVAI
jgi:hypothetical protein